MSHEPEIAEGTGRYLSPSGQSLLSHAQKVRATRIHLPRTAATRILTFAIAALPGAWALGLAEFMWPILVLPMALFILRRSRVSMPRAFFLWLAYLALAIVAAISAADGLRIISVYFAATVVFLFAYNASSDELPDNTIVALVALFWVLVVVGGVLGLIFGTAEFPSLANTLFVDESQLDTYWDDVTRVQLSDGLKAGEMSGLVLDHRPKGFLAYANHFGAAVVMFMPAIALLRLQVERGRFSLLLDLVAVAAIFPFIVSRNRWAWLSLLLVTVYIIARLWRPFPQSARALVTGLAVVLVVIAVTPLGGVVTERLEGESSNQYRSEQYRLSWNLIQTSPWLGFGGNQQSDEIAVTSQTEYEDLHLGADSQILQTMINHGIPALVLYGSWLIVLVAVTRTAITPILAITHLAALVAILHAPFYILTPHRWMLLMVVAGASFRYLNDQGRGRQIVLWSSQSALETQARRRRRRNAAS